MGGRERTCCFTGHRPEKLPWGWDEEDPRCRRLKEKLRDAVETAYEEGMRHFICGMARGCDFYFAEAVLDLRRPPPGRDPGGGHPLRRSEPEVVSGGASAVAGPGVCLRPGDPDPGAVHP